MIKENLILPELTLLANLESYNAILINQGKNQISRGGQNGRPCCPRNDGLVIVNFSAHIDSMA